LAIGNLRAPEQANPSQHKPECAACKLGKDWPQKRRSRRDQEAEPGNVLRAPPQVGG